MFSVYLKNLSIPKNLRTLKTNFEEADGLGIRQFHSLNTLFSQKCKNQCYECYKRLNNSDHVFIDREKNDDPLF